MIGPERQSLASQLLVREGGERGRSHAVGLSYKSFNDGILSFMGSTEATAEKDMRGKQSCQRDASGRS